jgi:DNA polymerase III epsilon subunit-like protein
MSTAPPSDPSSPAGDEPPPIGGPPVGTVADADATAAPTSAGRRQGRTRFVFMDTEATGLDHHRHELTEVAWVVRFEDGREEERQFFPEHTTDGADADALELTHYEDRIAPQQRTPASEWLTLFLEDAQDAVLVGAVPDFDAKHLERMCRKLGAEPTWDHHLLDVETLALPFIAPGPESPRSLAKTCAALGIPHDKDQAHGALYDAQQAMRVFDRVWELVSDLRATGDPLPPPVPRDPNGRGNGGNGGNGQTAPAPNAGEEPNAAAPNAAEPNAAEVPGATEPGDDPQLSPEERAERATHHG